MGWFDLSKAFAGAPFIWLGYLIGVVSELFFRGFLRGTSDAARFADKVRRS